MTSDMTLLIHNAHIITEETQRYGWLLCYRGIIRRIATPEEPMPPADHIIDAQGHILTSGFIDLHVHGAVGADTMDADVESLSKMAHYFVTQGVTSFLPTTLTASPQQTLKALNVIEQAMKHPQAGASQILGAHLEGPFINPAKSGAQNSQHIRPIDREEALALLDTAVIRILSFAPEDPRADWLIAQCQQRNITASIAHTNADYRTAERAIQQGMTHSTHTYNAMTGLHHRQPGVVGAVMTHTRVRCELICDDQHVHPIAQKILWQIKGCDGIILITDAIRATGMPSGKYFLGDYAVNVHDQTATLEDGTLAGSVLNYDEGVRRFVRNIDQPFTECWRTTSLNPARAIGIDDRKGSIAVGKDADIVLLDADLNVYTTIVQGRVVYQR